MFNVKITFQFGDKKILRVFHCRNEAAANATACTILSVVGNAIAAEISPC